MTEDAQKEQKESYERNLIRKAILFIEDVTENGELTLFEGFNQAEIDKICVSLKKFCEKFDLEKNLEKLSLEGRI
jgi:hypothetical protein